METVPDPYLSFTISTLSVYTGVTAAFGVIVSLVILVFLFICSGFASASETAFFSLTSVHLESIRKTYPARAMIISKLLQNPNNLLATLLIVNNLVNIAIVLMVTYLSYRFFDLSNHPIIGFLVETIAITFLLLVFGEVTPKVYSAQNAVRTATRLAWPVFFVNKLCSPASYLLNASVEKIGKKLKSMDYSISVDELSHALAYTTTRSGSDPEHRMLKSIVSFGRTEVRQVMTPRTDILAVNTSTSFADLVETIISGGFSRMPVYTKTLDNINGILFIKDLLPFLEEPADFSWQHFVHPPFIVPETQKIDDLLRAFQKKRVHMAVAVDEYGSTTGIITLEDILEEIVGEITDEFDDDNLVYTRLDDNNYLFEGKTSLHNICRIMNIDYSFFEKGNFSSVTVGGFCVEMEGAIPQKNRQLHYRGITFTIEASDNKKIDLVKITLPKK